MEQDSCSDDHGGRGVGDRSGVDNVVSNNQEEEEEEQEEAEAEAGEEDGDGEGYESAYDSDNFDDPSKVGASGSEFDSRDYGLDEDDQSSFGGPTDDGSTTRTPETEGKGAARGEAGQEGSRDLAGEGNLDNRNSLSSYADDDFGDDESIVPPGESNTTPPSSEPPTNAESVAATSDDEGSRSKEKEGRQSLDNPNAIATASATAPASATASASAPAPRRDSNAKQGATGGGGGGNGGNGGTGGGRHGYDGNSIDRSGRDQSETEGLDRRQSSVSGKKNIADTNADGFRIPADAPSTREGRVGSDAAAPPHPSLLISELEERLRRANLENDRLREAVKMSTTAVIGEGDGSRKELEILKSQVEAARAMMMSSLDGGDEGNPDRSLLELVLLAESRGYQQAEENAEAARTASEEGKRRKSSSPKLCANAGTDATAAAVKVESIARAELEKRVESLERDLMRAGQESRAQSARAASLQRQLDAGAGGGVGRSGSTHGRRGSSGGGGGAGGDGGPGGITDGFESVAEGLATADIMALKAKANQLVERLRQEKAARLKAERKTQRVAGKVQVLSDHIEKLMMFLKHEATQKAKAHVQQRRLQKELELVKARSTALLRSNQTKDRVTTEMREGSKILEDQLRLMDEKYMELRTKLDWTRTKADKDVRRARAQASVLRTKWAILSGKRQGGDSSLLDTVRVDSPVHSMMHSSSAPAGVAAAMTTAAGVHAGNKNNGSTGDQAKFNSISQLPQQPQQQGGGGLGGGAFAPVTRGREDGGERGSLFPVRQQHHQRSGILGGRGTKAAGGGQLKGAIPMPVGVYVAGGAAAGGGGGSSLAPGGLSAGSDPGGGGIFGDDGAGRGGSGGAGAQRPPWTEQGGVRGVTGGGRQQSPQVLFA